MTATKRRAVNDIDPSPQTTQEPHPALVFLSGRRRGSNRFLDGQRITVGTSPESDVRLVASSRDQQTVGAAAGQTLAILHKRGHTYEIEAVPGVLIRINGQPVERLVLASGDVIELSDSRDVLRFRLYPSSRGPYKSMSEAFSDCLDSARHGSDSTVAKAGLFLAGVPRELGTRTAPLTRAGFWVLLALLLSSVGTLLYRNVRLERQLAAESRRVEGLAELLERTEADSFSRNDYDEAQTALEQRLEESISRLEALESRAEAPSRVIADAEPSIVFVQGAYGFVDPASGRPLRFMVASDGRVIRSPNAVTLEGGGPEVEVFFTGTAFVASPDGHLLTNRHVALPWLYDEAALRVAAQGLEPTMRRFIGYLPDGVDPFEVELVRASDDSDLAVLRSGAPPQMLRPLTLAREPPIAGEQVILMGYPAGIRALIARAGEEFARELEASGPIGFWEVVAMLAAADHIDPLPTQGIVGRTSPAAIVYDAQTTSGGSGGPVIDLEGNVVAVNSAVLPEFGGSNIGVPANKARELLAVVLPSRRAIRGPR